jgi:hypothetical protein
VDTITEETVESQSKGFAELMFNFNKLTEMESKIEAAIENAKVPWTETRKFLKGLDINQVLNTPLAQFIQDLFREMGLGDLELSEKGNFRYIYQIKDCPVCGLFKDIPDKKVCQPTVDAIYRFFAEDLGLEGEVQETKCLNVEDDYCEFKMDLQPFPVLEKALDKTDLDVLKEINDTGTMDIKTISDKLELDEDELQARLVFLQYYEILDDNYKLSPVGQTFYKYRSNLPYEEEEYFDPPWKSMAELTSTIAATQSFAEALVVVSEEEKLPWEVDEAELIDIRERAKDKSGFAELLSAEAKKESDKDEND